MIKLKNINKSFGDNHVLKDISLEFKRGETNLIIGESGSGKTVLLKTIIGLHEVDSGQVIYDNKIFSQMSQKEKKSIRQEIGMVFQGGALFNSATVMENVIFPLQIFSEMQKKEMIERAEFCLRRVNLNPDEVSNLYPSETSGGMQKRIAIARAIVLNPKYLFFDEPNSGLDPKTAIVIDNLIRKITVEFNTVTVINTHDMNSVAEIGDNVAFIFEGQCWWEGNKHEIFESSNDELNKFVFATELMRNIRDLKQNITK